MLVVDTIAKIRREHFAQGKGARMIARELGLSRNTVRKVLRSGETSFDYERSEQPHHNRYGRTWSRTRRSMSGRSGEERRDKGLKC